MPSSATLYTLGIMDGATFTHTSGASATGFPLQNMFDWNPDTYWKPSSTAGQTIDIDLGSAQTIDHFAVWIHNYNTDYDSGTQAIGLASDDNDNGSYSAVTGFVAEYWDNTIGTPIYFPDATPAAARTKRYWRFTVANMTAVAEISGIFLLRKREIGLGNIWPENDAEHYRNRIISAPGGRTFSQRVNRSRSLEIPRSWVFHGTTNWEALRDAFRDSYGAHLPLILVEGSNSYLVRFADDALDMNQSDYQIYRPSVRFVQVPYIADGDSY